MGIVGAGLAVGTGLGVGEAVGPGEIEGAGATMMVPEAMMAGRAGAVEVLSPGDETATKELFAGRAPYPGSSMKDMVPVVSRPTAIRFLMV